MKRRVKLPHFHAAQRFKTERERLIISNDDYAALLSNFPNYLRNLENDTDVSKTLSKICSLFCHESFTFLPIFNDAKFVNNLRKFLDYGDKEAICVLKIAGNAWCQLTDLDSCFADQMLVARVCQFCSNFGAPDALPYAFFAAANFYGISRAARQSLMGTELRSSLLRFLKCFSRNQHLKAGLRLLNNLLLFDSELGDDGFNIQVIPVLRCHIMHINPEIRVLATKCLIFLLEKGRYAEKMIEYDVHECISSCIIESNRKMMYFPDVYDAATFFVTEDAFECFLTPDFINSIRFVLCNEQENTNFYSLFRLLSLMIPKIYEKFNGLLFEDLLPVFYDYSMNSIFHNKVGACLCFSKILEQSSVQIRLDLAEKGILEAFILILEDENEDDLYWLLYHIHDIISLDYNRFKQICFDNNLISIISRIVSDDEFINTQIHLISELLTGE